MKHNPQEYKERSKNYFDEMSSDYSIALGEYTEPMHYALITELGGKISRHYWMWDVGTVYFCQWF